jgi:hypothetical protein
MLLLGGVAAGSADTAVRASAREALQPFNDLIGSWRGTGQPEGSREAKQKGFWTETIQWEWQFKGDDAWLKVAFDKGKHFTKGELRPLPEPGRYQLQVETPDQQKLTFVGTLQDRKLTLDRIEEATQTKQRIVVSLIHEDRFLYRFETQPQGKPLFVRQYQVGATKEGSDFAGVGDSRPECVVSGGLGTMRVSYKGETYYVCCTGCRDAFNDTPEKYIQEYAARKAQEKKDKKR